MRTIGVILGGGVGSRLKPLTSKRSKPAVPVAGKYRLVDIPISNCINSDIKEIYLLTQFNSVSLHRHIQSAYIFDHFTHGYVRLLAAEQTPESGKWFQGTADAVRQSLHHLLSPKPELIVILSGDQLYRMDFRQVIAQHLATGAEVTLATKPVLREEAGALGVLCCDPSGRITRFVEKPGEAGLTEDLRAPMAEERYLANMGIYVFNSDILQELLLATDESDFGKHIIPTAIDRQRVFSYIFDGYWKDIGTVGMFWQANLALTAEIPEFTFYDAAAPIYTHPRYLPPSKINHCDLIRCLVTEGSILSAQRIEDSILGLRSIVREGTVIEKSIIMGSDYYEFEGENGEEIPLGIGRNCHIRQAIIDKNVRIGNDVTISPAGKKEGSTDLYTVRDGIIVIPQNSRIPSGTII
jgi:glucose-1-phosphate adenylyltransferase